MPSGSVYFSKNGAQRRIHCPRARTPRPKLPLSANANSRRRRQVLL